MKSADPCSNPYPPPHAQQITFFEEGEPLVDGEPGDLVFVVRQVGAGRDGGGRRQLTTMHPGPLTPASSAAATTCW